YRALLPKYLLKKIEKLKTVKPNELSLSSETWAKIVYSFLAAFKRAEQTKKEHLLDALRILWIGKIGAFVNETFTLNDFEAEEKINQEMNTFRKLRNYLLKIY
ncbi:MAG: hypothetical protein Q9M37_10430, partial [Desulfonauticus sp.]|nr:hypothetical protein [Desulfonauticus sp.]